MDEPEAVPVPVAGPVCPWCSAALTSADQPACPSCGANLVGDPEAEIEGVTALDQDTRVRLGLAQRAAIPPTRRGFMSWMGSSDESEPTLDPEMAAILVGASVEPPSDDVRREMIRLEMEALRREVGEMSSVGDIDAPALDDLDPHAAASHDADAAVPTDAASARIDDSDAAADEPLPEGRLE